MNRNVAHRLVIEQAISHYRIVEKLGDGGMGVAYKAEETELGHFVALKFLALPVARPASARTLSLGGRAASALNHPNICIIYKIGEHREQSFIAMELSGWYDAEASDSAKTVR